VICTDGKGESKEVTLEHNQGGRKDTFIVQTGRSSAQSGADKSRTIRFSDGRNVHVMDRETLQRAIVAAMKEQSSK